MSLSSPEAQTCSGERFVSCFSKIRRPLRRIAGVLADGISTGNCRLRLVRHLSSRISRRGQSVHERPQYRVEPIRYLEAVARSMITRLQRWPFSFRRIPVCREIADTLISTHSLNGKDRVESEKSHDQLVVESVERSITRSETRM